MWRSASLCCALALLAAAPARADNPYSAAGITDPAVVTGFVAALKRAVAAGDEPAVAAAMSYPLKVYRQPGKPQTFRSRADVLAHYHDIMTPGVQAAIRATPTDHLFARDQGVMIGHGEVWMNQVHGRMKITSINPG